MHFLPANYGNYGVPAQAAMGPGQAGVPPVPFEIPRDVFRYGEQALYSTYYWIDTTALANGTYRLFTTGLGNSGQGFTGSITITETNLKESGRIPNAQAYDVFGVAGQLFSVSTGGTGTQANSYGRNIGGATVAATISEVEDYQNINNGCVLFWDFTQTKISIAPLSMCGAGGGLFGALGNDPVTAAATGSAGWLSNGNGSIWIYRRHPVQLPGATTFAVEAQFGSRVAQASQNAAVAFMLRVVLLGYYKNVVELG